MTDDYMEIQISLARPEQELLFDPQTSGGLLLSVPHSQADQVLAALFAAGVKSAVPVGEVLTGPPALVVV